MTNKPHIFAKCPDCQSELTYEAGFGGNYWEPSQPEALFCEHCEWEPDDAITNYIHYQEKGD